MIFDAAANLLEGLPETALSMMHVLQHLDVSDNRISEVPPCLGRLRALRSLKLNGNLIRDARLREALEAGINDVKAYLASRAQNSASSHLNPTSTALSALRVDTPFEEEGNETHPPPITLSLIHI